MKKELRNIIIVLALIAILVVLGKVTNESDNSSSPEWNTYTNENFFYSLKYPKNFYISSSNERITNITSYDMFDPVYERGNLEGLKFQMIVIPGSYSNFEMYDQATNGDMQIYTHKNWSAGSGSFVMLDKFSHIVTDLTKDKTLGLYIWDPSGEFTTVIEEMLNSFKFFDEPLNDNFLTYKNSDPSPFPPSAFGVSYPYNFQVQSGFGYILVGPYENFEDFYYDYKFDLDSGPWLNVSAFWDTDMNESTPENLLKLYNSHYGTAVYKAIERDVLTGRTIEIDGYEAVEIISRGTSDKGTSWVLTTYPDKYPPQYYDEGDLSFPENPTPTPEYVEPEDSPLIVYIESTLENFPNIPEGTVESIIKSIEIDL